MLHSQYHVHHGGEEVRHVPVSIVEKRLWALTGGDTKRPAPHEPTGRRIRSCIRPVPCMTIRRVRVRRDRRVLAQRRLAGLAAAAVGAAPIKTVKQDVKPAPVRLRILQTASNL